MQFVHVWPKPGAGGTGKEGEGAMEGDGAKLGLCVRRDVLHMGLR